MTEIPKSRLKDVMTAAEFQAMHRNGVRVSKGKRLKTQELLPEYEQHLNNKETRFCEYVIPHALCTLNDYINAERTDKYKAANIKKRMTNLCAKYCAGIELNSN